MSEVAASSPRGRIQVQVIAVMLGVAAAINVAFYFLSARYFEDRQALHGMVTPAHLTSVRGAFGLFTGAVTLGAIGASLSPRLIGHGLAAFGALAALAGSFAAFASNAHIVMPVSLLVTGVLMSALVYGSLRGSRVSWSFLAATCAVLATVTLFGATKVRVALDIGLWYALVLPGMFVVATAALSMIRLDYADRR